MLDNHQGGVQVTSDRMYGQPTTGFFKTRTVWLANSRLAFHLMTLFVCVCVCVPTPPSSVQMHGYEWNDVRGLLNSVFFLFFFTFIILWVGMGGRVTPHGPSPSFCPASLTSQREKWVNIYTHNHVDFNLYIKPDTTWTEHHQTLSSVFFYPTYSFVDYLERISLLTRQRVQDIYFLTFWLLIADR